MATVQSAENWAMVLRQPGAPLERERRTAPRPGPNQLLAQIEACGVCRTDLHLVSGELAYPKLPVVPGHEIVGIVRENGSAPGRFAVGARVGIPWLGWTCGACEFCRSGRENLCSRAQFHGYTLDGGYAQWVAADERFCFAMPKEYSAVRAAPLLCAGLIGYRALRKAGSAERIGFYGFGASAHILAQIAAFQGRKVFAFTRPGDARGQKFALGLGAFWAGDSTQTPPEPLDAAIIFAPVGALVPQALQAVQKGAPVICAGIHMSDIPSFRYARLWEERSICSVANLTRQDGKEFFELAPKIPVQTTVECFALAEANEALEALRSGRIHGAAVLVP